MKTASMRFAGCSWQYNPQTLSISGQKNIAENKIHNSDSIVQSFGRLPRSVSGEGYLCGENCFERMDKLWGLYRRKEEGTLTIPCLTAMRAVFTRLELLVEPKDDLIKYRFGFIEVMREDKMRVPIDTHTVISGESLWDISYRYGVDIDTLMRLNPTIRHPFYLYEGEEVRLC